jgi:acetyltransferase-like isoleucine patch superfamily enzyme
MLSIAQRGRRELSIARIRFHLRRHGVTVGVRPTLVRGWLPDIENEGTITVGDRPVFFGIEARTSIRSDPGGVIEIGDRVLINSAATIRASSRVSIGDDVKIGSHVSVSDLAGHEISAGDGIKIEPVRVGNNVWIGRGVIVLPGVTIGDGAVIGAGSIVTRDIEPHTVSVGSPARTVRKLPAIETARR